MNARAWTLAGLFAGAAGLFVYSRTQSGQQVLGSVADTVSTLPETLVSKLSHGFRLNNPGNIMQSSVTYDGEVQPSSDPYEKQFKTLSDGLRAIAVTIKAYYNLHGLNTVDGLIRRYSATDQDAYVANVSKGLGVDAYEYIDPTDNATLNGLVKYIVRQENGILLAASIPDSQISNAVALA